MGAPELLVYEGLVECQVVGDQIFPDFSRVNLTLSRRIGENAWEACNTVPIPCTVMPWPEIRKYDTDAVDRLARQDGTLRLMFPDGYEVDGYPAGHPVPIKLGEQVLQAPDGKNERFRVDVVPIAGSVGVAGAMTAEQ